MKVHDQRVLDLVNRAAVIGTELRLLLRQLESVDTDALCRHCGAEALQLDDNGVSNRCERCGHVQADGETITLSDELWPSGTSYSAGLLKK